MWRWRARNSLEIVRVWKSRESPLSSVFTTPYHPADSIPTSESTSKCSWEFMMDGGSECSRAYRRKLNVTNCKAGTIEGPWPNYPHQRKSQEIKKTAAYTDSQDLGTLLPTIAVCALVWGMMTRLLHGSCNVLIRSSLMREQVNGSDALW